MSQEYRDRSGIFVFFLLQEHTWGLQLEKTHTHTVFSETGTGPWGASQAQTLTDTANTECLDFVFQCLQV